MYKLTPRMLQRFKNDLIRYHELFSGGRCSAWEQEELIVNAIKSDTQAQHHVLWSEAGHDDKADITVKTNDEDYLIQIKSGKVTGNYLNLSGHRLGRFNANFEDITDYLNKNKANIITVPYRLVDGAQGRAHIYEVCYINVKHLTGLKASNWNTKGKSFEQINDDGVIFKLSPSMSWQIWWKVPLPLLTRTAEIVIQ